MPPPHFSIDSCVGVGLSAPAFFLINGPAKKSYAKINHAGSLKGKKLVIKVNTEVKIEL